MELHLKLIGWILTILALVHGVFPKYFNWKKELASLSLINRQIMYVHTFFIAIVVLLMGLLCIFFSKELIETPLGNIISLGLCIFWTLRLIIQFFGYSSVLWKGKRLETFVHVIFGCLWAYLSVIFCLIYCNMLP